MYSGRPSVVRFDAYFCLYLVEVLCTQVVRLLSVLTSISVCT